MKKYLAAAKVNLALHVTGRLSNGYHQLDSLVTFTEFGDLISVEPADDLCLSISGPFSKTLSLRDDNLVLVAAHAVQKSAIELGYSPRGADIHLVKNLPIASGIGGGSADAAATLNALCAFWQIDKSKIDLHQIAQKLGADVPMCLASTPLRATGIGDEIEPVTLPALDIVMVNPGIEISTPEIFRALKSTTSPPLPRLENITTVTGLVDWLNETQNDLQAVADTIEPEILTVLDALMENQDCLFARMSGSGATCFGIFSTPELADTAARNLAQIFPSWWCIVSKTIATKAEH